MIVHCTYCCQILQSKGVFIFCSQRGERAVCEYELLVLIGTLINVYGIYGKRSVEINLYGTYSDFSPWRSSVSNEFFLYYF